MASDCRTSELEPLFSLLSNLFHKWTSNVGTVMLGTPSSADLVGADIYWGALQPETKAIKEIMSLINLRKAWINSVSLM